jgi:chromate transporter
LEGLALAQLAPGPLAAQLAIHLGYIRAGVFGATAGGMAFVLPSFLMVLALSAAYVHFGGLPWMQGMFYGIGARPPLPVCFYIIMREKPRSR